MFSVFIFSLSVNAQDKNFEKSIEIGYAIGVGKYTNDIFNLSIINGYRFNKILYAGIGVGLGYSNALNGVDVSTLNFTKEYRTTAILIPIYANIKANMSEDPKISPFLSMNIGYTIDANQYFRGAPGLYIKPNFGVDFKISDKTSVYGLAYNILNIPIILI
jgi:hypothetical protein